MLTMLAKILMPRDLFHFSCTKNFIDYRCKFKMISLYFYQIFWDKILDQDLFWSQNFWIHFFGTNFYLRKQLNNLDFQWQTNKQTKKLPNMDLAMFSFASFCTVMHGLWLTLFDFLQFCFTLLNFDGFVELWLTL